MELRILVHAPRGGDVPVIEDVLSGQLLACHVCESLDELIGCLDEGAAGAVLMEQALPGLLADHRLAAWIAAQSPWSDFPFIVLATRREGRRTAADAAALHSLGNLTLLERPLDTEPLASAAESALRERRRQYIAREHLDQIDRTRNELARLNAELEQRIETRTRELASANDRLMKEINERERAQAALTQAQKMEAIGRLTGGIAHDFNNLLHVVNMNLELVSMYAKEEKVKPVVERAKSAAKRGSKLTNQLLSFARNQSLLPRLVHVDKLLLGMRDLLEISAGPGVTVELEMCDQPHAVLIDTSQLEMAVLNLAVNSRDAMPEGGTLTISTCHHFRDLPEGELKAGPYVVVRVSDTGAGISPSVLQRVFDPFFTTKPVGSGSGLGLSQVYGFARQSGGVALIHSEIGQGTTVEMHFPFAAADAPESQPPADRAGPPRAVQPSKILVVEDDADVRRVIVECLGVIGYSVTEASNGAEGLREIERAKPDLLMVDYAMPDMTGAEVISRAREMVGDLPVILATGYADMAMVERLVGRPRVLRKPFDMTTLGEAVASVLERSHASEPGSASQ